MKQHFKTTLETILNTIPEGYSETALERICLQITFKALQGDFKSINFIRDTIGQAPFKELIMNEFVSNPSIEKLDSILEGLQKEASKSILIEAGRTEDQLQQDFFNKALERYGIEKIKSFTYEEGSLITMEDLTRQILSEEKEVNSHE